VFIYNEVMAEVVYVLQKVYIIERKKICSGLKVFLDGETVNTNDVKVIKTALDTYSDINIDFVDAILYAQSKINNKKIYTFDKKLKKLMNK